MSDKIQFVGNPDIVIDRNVLERCARRLVESISARWEAQTQEGREAWMNDALVVIQEYEAWKKEQPHD